MAGRPHGLPVGLCLPSEGDWRELERHLGVPHMGPPCVLRAGRITPTCTEGEHFCGVPVWRSFPDVMRRI